MWNVAGTSPAHGTMEWSQSVDNLLKRRYNTYMNTKRYYFAGTWFLPPFRTSHHWVEDATGKNVAEAASLELAKALADMLTKAAKETK